MRGRWVLPLLVATACSSPVPPSAVPTATAPQPPEPAAPATRPATDPTPEAPATLAAEPLQLPGRFESSTTVEDLRRRFGAGNVRVGDVPGPEGTTEHGVTLFPDAPAQRAYVYFSDAQRLSGLVLVDVQDPGSQWTLETPEGALRIGSTLAQVTRLNGGPFRFVGVGWDYGGYAVDWRGGRLARAWPAPRQPSVRFAIPQAWFERHADAPSPSGEGTFDTDDARWPQLELVVTELGLRIAR